VRGRCEGARKGPDGEGSMVNRRARGNGIHCTTAPRIASDRPIEHGWVRGDGGSQQSRCRRAQRLVFPRNPDG
jgi:hypothetical protein